VPCLDFASLTSLSDVFHNYMSLVLSTTSCRGVKNYMQNVAVHSVRLQMHPAWNEAMLNLGREVARAIHRVAAA
jgi:hypothetical protein